MSLIYFDKGEAQVLSATKRAIGDDRGSEQGFITHRLHVTRDTSFYLFSDGYQDQFGGEKNTKFSKKRLLSLVGENHKKDMAEQSDLLKAELDSWKGSNPQVDDVCIMGCRVGGFLSW